MIEMPANRYRWIAERLAHRNDLLVRKMFGCLACYLGGKLVLVLGDKKEPWNGILLPTDHHHQSTLKNELGSLRKHPVLGKWLYLSEKSVDFEETSVKITQLILKSDLRIGVEPKQRRVRKPKRSKPR